MLRIQIVTAIQSGTDTYDSFQSSVEELIVEEPAEKNPSLVNADSTKCKQ